MFGMSQKLLWEKNFQLPGDSYLNRTSILAPAARVARLVSRGGVRRESQCCQEFPKMEKMLIACQKKGIPIYTRIYHISPNSVTTLRGSYGNS